MDEDESEKLLSELEVKVNSIEILFQRGAHCTSW